MKGQARFYDGAQPADLTIIDISPAGARLVVPAGVSLQPTFDLFIPARNDTRYAQIRWQTPEAIGVEFTSVRGVGSEAKLASDVLTRLVRIENIVKEMQAGGEIVAAKQSEPVFVAPAPTAPVPTPLPAEEPKPDPVHDLLKRVERLEKQNAEIVGALKTTLAMLGELRQPAAAQQKAG